MMCVMAEQLGMKKHRVLEAARGAKIESYLLDVL